MRSGLSAKIFASSVLTATLVSAAGCRKADEAPSVDRVMETPFAATVASSSDLTGIWTVVGHHIPGISAMSDIDAAAWHGRAVRLTALR